MDDKLFDYPMIYFVEPGFLELSDEQAARLREYVARGGFMFFDDFWGDYEWQNLETQLHKIWPDRDAKGSAAFASDFSFLSRHRGNCAGAEHHERASRRRRLQRKAGSSPTTAELRTKTAGWLFSFPSTRDLGDAWEWINDPSYPAKYGLPAYKTAINVIIYAMSH